MTLTRKKLTRPAIVLAGLLLAVPGLAGCGDDQDSSDTGGETHTAANGNSPPWVTDSTGTVYQSACVHTSVHAGA